MVSAAFKELRKGMESPAAKAKETTAQANGWATFTKQFQNVDKTQFLAQVSVDEKRNITAEIFFKAGGGLLQSMFGSDRHHWSQKMKAALGLAGAEVFPYQLLPMKNKTALPILAVDFTKAVPSLKKISNKPTNIYVMPDLYFTTKLREIFQKTRLRHTTSAESKHWLGVDSRWNIGHKNSTWQFSARPKVVYSLMRSLTME